MYIDECEETRNLMSDFGKDSKVSVKISAKSV